MQHAHAHGGATDAGPTAEEIGGRGLWLVNHLCGLVQIRSSAGGTVVRLHLALAA